MGITERREREREEVRRKILDAARELFATEGYENVTMRRIAEAIEYSPTTIYLHFEDKDDLVRALCHEDFGRLLEAMRWRRRLRGPRRGASASSAAPTRASRSQNPNHYRFMFMTPAARTSNARGRRPGRPVLRAPARRGEARDRGRPLPARSTRSPSPRCCGRASTASSPCSSPCRPDSWPHGPAAPDLVEQVIDNGLRGLLGRRREA